MALAAVVTSLGTFTLPRGGVFLDEARFESGLTEFVVEGTVREASFVLRFSGVSSLQMSGWESWEEESASSFDELLPALSSERRFVLLGYDQVFQLSCQAFTLVLRGEV